MNVSGAVHWVEAHPLESLLIGGGSVLVIAWALGAFSGGGSGANAGASNLASAYYAAEAQQAVVGGQIQQATIAAAASTAQTGINANAAVAINAANQNAATTINGQNVGAATTINGQQIALGIQQSADALQATYSNNGAAVAENAANNASAQAIAANNNQSSLWSIILGKLLPQEMAQASATGSTAQLTIPGFGSFASTPVSVWDFNALANAGYSPAQIKQVTGIG